MINNNIYALLIGVGDYKKIKISDLPSYRMDVALIGTGLIFGLKCMQEHIRFMAGEDNNGFVSISSLAKGVDSFKRALSTEDTFIFYFSGHGSSENLVFSDGQVDQQSVINYIDQLPCKNKIVILDCCYSGKFETLGAIHLSIEQSLDMFAGYGIAVYASSSDDEVSRFGSNGNHSMFTGVLSTAMISQSVVHKGQIALDDIYRETQRLVQVWNTKNPGKEQHPIYRSSMGGTIYFKVMEYKPCEPEHISVENEKYKVTNVKPLSTASEKRLSAFVILKEEASADELVSITKEIAESIKYANVYSSEKSAALHANMPAKAVWCYFGMDENDMVNHTHAYYTIWAADDVKNKYYRENTNAKVVDGIYIFKNTSYDLVRKMQEHTISKDEYIKQCKNYLKLFVDKAEDFCVDLMEVYNCKLSFSELQRRYEKWIIKVKQEFIQLSDMEVAPEEIHDWVEEIMQLSGWILDLSIYLEGDKHDGTITDREEWLIQNTIKKYHESLEKLKELEMNIK